MQIAFLMICRSPRLFVITASKYLMWPRQSQPNSKLLAHWPMPYSPESNAFFRFCVGPGSPYGTTISDSDARYKIERFLAPSWYVRLCNVNPSRELKPMITFHFCQLTSW